MKKEKMANNGQFDVYSVYETAGMERILLGFAWKKQKRGSSEKICLTNE